MITGRAAATAMLSLALVGCTRGGGPAGSSRPAPSISSVPVAAEPAVDLLPHRSVGCPRHPQVSRTGLVEPPAHPAHAARIAPPETPAGAIVCLYAPGLRPRLTGSRQVTRGLDALTDDIAWRPLQVSGAVYACAADLIQHFGFLILLRYPDGDLWVGGDTGGCTGLTNGTATSDFGLGSDVTHAYATGSWVNGVGIDPPNACFVPPTGRLGQERRLVPGSPSQLTLCPSQGRAVTTTDFSRLLRLLNSRPARPTSSSCQPDDPSANMSAYEARFSYPQGPPVVVSIDRNCEPKLSNHSLDANDDGAAWREADRLYRGG